LGGIIKQVFGKHNRLIMGRFIYGRTEKCCECYAIATNWSGWLIKSRDGIVAGFCNEHKPAGKKYTTFGSHNLRGIYNKNMGETVCKLKPKNVIKKFGLDKNLSEQ
jgi:hypothetical protein